MAATLTVKGLALKLGYTEYWIRELARTGKIAGVVNPAKIGGVAVADIASVKSVE